MLLTYEQFLKKRAIRKLAHVGTPPINRFDQLELPKQSSIHFPQYGEDVVGVPQNHFLLSHIKKIMFGKLIREYTNEPRWGDPRPTTLIVEPLIKEWVQHNRQILPMKGGSSNDPLTMYIYCYGLLNMVYKYPVVLPTTVMHSWFNYWETVFMTLTDAVKGDNRQHFIIIDAPYEFPTIDKLKEFTKQPWTKKTVLYFPTESHWWLLSFWKLFHGVVEPELNPVFSRLPRECWSRINIIFKMDTMCLVFNLDTMMSFCSTYNEKSSFDGFRFSKMFINLFLLLKEARNTSIVDVPDDSDEVDESIDGVDSLDEMEDIGDGDVHLREAKKVEKARQKAKQDLDGMFSNRPVFNTVSAKTKLEKADAESNDDGEEEVIIDELEIEERLSMASELSSSDNKEELTGDDLAYKTYNELFPKLEPEDEAVKVATRHARNGLLSAGEVRHATKLAKNYTKLKNPKNPNESFVSMLTINEDDTKIGDTTTKVNETIANLVPDESMHSTRLKAFDDKYVDKVMHKHIAQSIMAINKLGVTVQGYEVDRVKNINNDFEIHTVRVTTVTGKQSTIRFRLPTINSNGTFTVNGVETRMRKQWNDIPIRKIGPTEVSLSSYYSKLFVRRTDRKAFNYESWLMNTITAMGIDSDNNTITDVRLNDVFDNYKKLPRAYTIMAKRVSGFHAKGYDFSFDCNKAEELFGKPKPNMIAVAKHSKNGSVLYMELDSGFIHTPSGVETIESFLDLDLSKAPMDYAEVDIYGRSIPLVLVLGYHIGLGNLLKTLGVKYERLQRVTPEQEKLFLTVKFKEEYLAVDRTNEVACLILNGFNRFKNDIRKYSIYAFDTGDVYASVFDNNGIDLRYLKELQTMFLMWVDPITKDVLTSMGEPTELFPLLIRATELLLTDQHPDSMDTDYMRIRGYERFGGFLYAELAKAARDYNWRPNRKDKAFTMHPDSVWYSVLNDESCIMTEGSNPIHALKEQEIVVYRGQGGRNSDTMVGSTRKYHPNSKGLISEASVDSKDVGTIVYLSANPQLENVYGGRYRLRGGDTPAASMISTSMLLSAGADIDDPKRTGFTSIQNSQTMPIHGYKPVPVRTGYERVVGSRTTDLFCRVADQDGKVTDISNNVMTVEYKDGSVGKYQFGKRYVKWSGKTVIQTTECMVKVGDSFKQGETLLHNPVFFSQDKLAPKQSTFNMARLARIAFIEGGDVYEDSCAISQEFSQILTANTAQIRNIILDSTQDITNLLKVGTPVSPDTILCTILNTQTDSSYYDADTLALLEKISSTSPKAKCEGVIAKIDAIYTGDVETLPEGVKDIVIQSDKEIYRTAKKLGEPVTSGLVDIGFRVDGKSLPKNTVVVRIHIDENLSMGTGDKLVVSHQLKATIARVWTDTNTTEDGQAIDAYFSGNSADKRVVNSPFLIGTTGSLLVEITKQAVNKYFNEKED